jgi:hypothetical protein
MSLRLFLLACALALLGWPTTLAAQGLGDHAARERARRAVEAKDQKADPRPAYTDHDLKVYRPAGSEDDDDEAGEDGQGGGDDASEDEAREERRRADRQRVRGRSDPNRAQRDEASQAQSQVDRMEARIRELNGKLNPMSRDYVYGQARSVDAAHEEIQIRQELSDLEGQLQGARQDLVEANAELSSADRGAYNPRDDE